MPSKAMPAMIRVLAVLQARTSSSRLPGKVLADLIGAPMLLRQIERVKRRAQTDGKVAAAFGALDVDALVEKLALADIAFGRVNVDPRSADFGRVLTKTSERNIQLGAKFSF